MSLNPATIRREIEQRTCVMGESQYRFAVTRATVQPCADAALAPHRVQLEMSGIRTYGTCAMAPEIPLHLHAWVTSLDDLLEIVEDAWREKLYGLQLKTTAPRVHATMEQKNGALVALFKRMYHSAPLWRRAMAAVMGEAGDYRPVSRA